MPVYASLRELRIRDFSGGPNLRDAQGALANNEAVDGWNVTFDERGGVGKRLGFSKYNPTSFAAALVQHVYYWPTGRNLITQAGASLYKDTSNVAVKTFTTAARVGFADFVGRLCVIHPVDGLFTSLDGTTFTAVADVDAPKGSTLAAWQNKLYAAGNPTNKARVTWSDEGNPDSWTPASFIDLREKDGEQVVALSGASGIDVSGRPGLLAFKQDSTYRIYDRTTGNYDTLDPQVGAASALAVVNLFGRTIVLSKRGIFWTDGVGGLRQASERFEPLFKPEQIAFDKLNLFAAGARADRVYFSLPRAGATANNLALEYHPIQGWISPRSDAMSCYATYAKDTAKLYGGSPSVNGQVYELGKGGSDDGTAIASYFQTRWFEPNDGIQSRMRVARVIGRGNFNLYRRKDYELGQGMLRAVAIPAGGFVWNAPGSTWNSGIDWGPAKVQAYQDLFSLGVARAVSFRVDETSSIVKTTQPLLGSGAASEVGAWSLYGVDLLHVALGTS